MSIICPYDVSTLCRRPPFWGNRRSPARMSAGLLYRRQPLAGVCHRGRMPLVATTHHRGHKPLGLGRRPPVTPTFVRSVGRPILHEP